MNLIRVTLLSFCIFYSLVASSQKYLGVVLAYGSDVKGQKVLAVDKVLDESPAAFIGMERGDIILSINNKSVSTQNELIELISKSPEKQPIIIQFQRQGIVEMKSFLPAQRSLYCTEVYGLKGHLDNGVAIWEFTNTGMTMKIDQNLVINFEGKWQGKPYSMNINLDGIDLKNPELFPIKDKIELLLHVKEKYSSLFQQLKSGSSSLTAIKFKHFYPEVKSKAETSTLDQNTTIKEAINPKIFPNPTASKINIDFQNWLTEGNFTFYIISAEGKIIKEASYTSANITKPFEYTFQNMSPGNYILMFVQGNRQYSRQIVYQPEF